MKFWYISFCDKEFLGGLHVWAQSFREAVKKAMEMGQHPGGEALGGEVPVEIARRIPQRYINRLLGKEEIAEAMKFAFPDDPEAAELVRVDSSGRVVITRRSDDQRQVS